MTYWFFDLHYIVDKVKLHAFIYALKKKTSSNNSASEPTDLNKLPVLLYLKKSAFAFFECLKEVNCSFF